MPVSVIENPYAYKLIYVFAIPDADHAGLLKVGETTVQCDLPAAKAHAALSPNCRALNDAARKRIDQYTQTAGVAYTLLHTELAVGGRKVIGDSDVHRVLVNSGHPREKPRKGAGREWFRTNLETVKNAIRAAKEGRNTLSVNEVSKVQEIVLRPSQREAVDLARRRFKAGAQKVLWNAKMRFGKTIAALTLAKEMGFRIMQFNAVVRTNVHARHLYERLGFTPLGMIPGGFRMRDGHYEDIVPYYSIL